ncbi:MAG TPA: DUF488 domain-containing protein [Burkholderiales bacterium]|nr:DUF488 domain-containing protein [Burkholderiales bacterium]
MNGQSFTIWTIGHGNRTASELVQMLDEAGVECLADVRSYPGSRRNPQFSREQLAALLSAHGIDYRWEGESLGGFRKPRADSKHVALRSRGFRGYADYMESAPFNAGVSALIKSAQKYRTAIMCAERLPWRCHRALISDYLVMQGISVTHLLTPGKVQKHKMNPAAKISNGGLVYDQMVQMRLRV